MSNSTKIEEPSLVLAGARKKHKSTFALTLERIMKNKSAMIGLSITLFLVLLAIISPWIIPYPYAQINVDDAFQGPSMRHFFGTDDLGRDIFSRILYGGRYSLRVGIMSVTVAMSFGILLGSIAGYFGGWVDLIVMRLLDIQQAIPGILLSVTIAAVLGGGFNNTIIALSIGGIPGCTRLLRAQILSVREKEYLEAARAIDCPPSRIIIKHILPNAMSPMIVQATLMIAGSLIAAAGLSYIGLGIQPPEPEWGAMLSAARAHIRQYPYMLIFPGLFIMTVVVSLNMFGDGLRDALDPKLKK